MVKILKLSFYYADYLNYFYNLNNTTKLSYENHQNLIFNDRFGWSDSFKDVFKTKNINVEEIIVNDIFLQKKWINENNSKKIDIKNWQIEILKMQLDYYRPEYIFLNNPSLENKFYELFSLYKIKLISYDGIKSHNNNILKYSDLIISCLKSTCDYYSSYNKKTYYMPHGFDERIINNIKNNVINNNPIFIGNIRNINHSKRVDLLYKAIQHTTLKIWIGDMDKNFKSSDIKKLFELKKIYQGLKSFYKINKIRKILKKSSKGIFGLEMYQLIRDHTITLNNHIDVTTDNEMANLRIFETTGLGSCLVTDFKKNFSEFFLDDEIVMYNSKDEAIDKINFLLRNKKIAEQIAVKGMKKTLKFHTIQKRWRSFHEFFLLNGL